MSRDTWMEEGTATHSRILAWEIPWTEEPGGLQSTESQKSWIWLNDYITTTSTHTHIYIYVSLCIITESICCIPKTLWINYIWIKYNFKKKKREIPGITGKFGLWVQNETGQRPTVLPRECTGQSTLVCQQHKRGLYTWTSPDGQHWNQIVYILCSQRWRSSIQSA